MTDQERQDAARARRGAMQTMHRPRQRHGLAAAGTSVRALGNVGSDAVHLSGLASAYERGYEMFDVFGPYTEIVSAGAGARSLATPGLDVALNLGHDQTHRIARTTNGTLQLRETSAGLEFDATVNPDDPDVQFILTKMRDGLTDQMSFAFQIVRTRWSDDFTTMRIEEYDIHRGDVAICGYGANPYTKVIERSGADLIHPDELYLLEYV